MLEGQGLLIDFGVAECDALLRVVVSHLLNGVTAEGFVVRLLQHPLYAFGKVFGIAVFCHVAIPLVVDLLRYATYLESHAWQSAGHRLHNGIWQILGE